MTSLNGSSDHPMCPLRQYSKCPESCRLFRLQNFAPSCFEYCGVNSVTGNIEMIIGLANKALCHFGTTNSETSIIFLESTAMHGNTSIECLVGR